MTRAMTALLTGLLLAAVPGLASADQALFEAKGCGECHYTDGPAKEKTIDDQLAKKGPELWYAGSKFQKKWMAKWLTDPKPIRPMAFNSLTEENKGDHPKLDKKEAKKMTAFLMGLTSDAVKAGRVKPKKSAKGRLIFTKKMPCSGCHQYPAKKKKIKGGRSAPSLVGAKKRLNPDWVLAYLENPSVFKPVKAMPTFAGIPSAKDMMNVARYVSNFK